MVIVKLNNECCMMGMGVEYVGDAGDLSISCESSLPLDALCTGTSQQIRILHKTNKKNTFSELLAFWKVC